MSKIARICRLAALLAVFAAGCFAQAPHAGFFQMSVVCGTESRRGWAQVFAVTTGSWQRYDDLRKIPAQASATAQVWLGPFGNILVSETRQIQHGTTETSYCFGPKQQLLALSYELRTAWGWGFSSVQRTEHGQPSSRFFDLRTARILVGTNLKGRNTVPLEPQRPMRFHQLPFASLVRPLSDRERY